MRASSRRTPRPLAIAILALLLGAPLSAAALRAADGTRIFHDAAEARSVVVGVVGKPKALDRSGRVAALDVTRVLSGRAGLPENLQLTWEELSPSREDRFREGESVLLVLSPVPSGTLWRKRFPEPASRARARRVAGGDKAFVRSPSPGAVNLLHHYWALPAEARRGPDGLRHLAALCAGAELPLAVSAARWLGSIQDPEASTTEPVAGLLADALLRRDAEGALGEALLGWLARAQPTRVRDVLSARIAAVEQPAPELLWALAHVEGELPEERTERLLAAGDPALRASAAGHAGPAQLGTLAALVAGDDASQVRSAAAVRAAALGERGFELALRAFEDPEASVRASAAHAVARSPALDLQRLRDVLFGWARPASETALVALRLVGSREARAVVAEAAASHPDDGIRALARLSLGRPAEDH